MQRHILYLAIIAVACLAGCKKQALPPASAPVYTSAKMNGYRILIGNAGRFGYPSAPDAFVQFEIKVLSDSSVLIEGDTLRLSSVDPISHQITFYHDNDPLSHSAHGVWLYYDSASNAMRYLYQFTTSYGGAIIDVSTNIYKPQPLVKNYVSDIAGTKALTGIGYDTLFFSPRQDSMYSINLTMNFTAINDSTISFDNDIFAIGNNTLHYKSTNDLAQTVTFETLHTYDYKLSTLTYNYATKHITFEQHFAEPHLKKHIVLQ